MRRRSGEGHIPSIYSPNVKDLTGTVDAYRRRGGVKESQKLILLKLSEGRSPVEAHFWIDSASLSSWADWHYANAKLSEACPDNVQSVCLYEGDLTSLLRVATWEDGL
jgi:hypothetical protein